MGKNNRRVKNRKFNRFEKGGEHHYVAEFTSCIMGETVYPGMLKCKLVHGNGYSIIVPDLIFVEGSVLKWIQPLFFTACALSKFDDSVTCRIAIDISHGYRLVVQFNNSDLITKLDDRSELYKCEVKGPKDLDSYCTGISINGNDPLISLYHHTNKKSHDAILKSRYFKCSPWNFQGSNKKVLTNVNYAYFTCLDSIKNNGDLTQIAMASSGKLLLLKDNGSPENPQDSVILDVYRENTTNRTYPINKFIPASLLAPSHLIKHYPTYSPVYYQVMNPFIYRVGLKPDKLLPFKGKTVTPNPEDIKRFEYVVIGDGRTKDGLIAPYDEENTSQILKIQKANENSNLLDFWFDEGNRDIFTGMSVEKQSFEQIDA